MKIGIDARFYGPNSKGLGRYTQKLIEHLEKIDDTNTYVIFLRASNFGCYQPKNIRFTKVIADYRWYSFAEQIFMPYFLYKEKCDLIHFPHFNVPYFFRGKFVVTIHDLILIHFPTMRSSTLHPLIYKIKFSAYKIVIKRAIMRARRVIAVSQFTKKDILKTYQIPSQKIVVTYEAGIEKIAQDTQPSTIIEKYGIIEPYVLYVGNAYPHKNLERLVGAFHKISTRDKNLSLVLVGKDDFFYNKILTVITKCNIRNVHILHNVSDDELKALYVRSRAYIFPSLYEGFGLPPLEAMAYGVPVAASDHPCLQEICGKAAYYFDARNTSAITDALLHIMTDDRLRTELINNGYENIKRFSWRKMAQETLEIYNKN